MTSDLDIFRAANLLIERYGEDAPIHAAIRAAGLGDDLTVHGLRYTAAVRLHELRCDRETIGDIMGHKTVAMVRCYLRKKRRTGIAITRLNRARRRRPKNGPGPKV